MPSKTTSRKQVAAGKGTRANTGAKPAAPTSTRARKSATEALITQPVTSTTGRKTAKRSKKSKNTQ